MAVSLVLRSGTSIPPNGDAEAPAMTFDLPRVVIGRGDGCDLRLPDLSVSHRHASVRQRGTEYIVMDEGSTNGTFIGSVRLSPQSPRVLRNGELIRVGRVWLEVRIEYAGAATQTALATKELALALVAHALDAQGRASGPRLVVIDGPDTGKQVELQDVSRPIVIGRGRDVTLELDVVEASRRHARVVRQGEQLLVRDLGSRIGTTTRGELVASDRDSMLRPGDSFEIGPDVFRFEFPAVDALRELERCDDEMMPAGEAVPPPVSPAGAEAGVSQQAEQPVAAPSRASAPASTAPAQHAPPRRRQAPRGDAGWSKTDVVIVLLALAVLGMSAVGLVWLFRGL